jgi:hypothetical protein
MHVMKRSGFLQGFASEREDLKSTRYFPEPSQKVTTRYFFCVKLNRSEIYKWNV